jgi:thiol-disulfide isomerase/thioredoxin
MTSVISAQKQIEYKMPDGQVFTQKIFDIVTKDAKENNLEIKIVDSISTDSKITRVVEIKSTSQSGSKPTKEAFNPYAKFDKLIGSKFPIDKFYKQNGGNFSGNYLMGKPSIINFWFTRCAPCIAELPYLERFRKNFKGSLNYLAITYNDRNTVNKFLKSKNFSYLQITDSKKQLKEMGVSSYPMTFIVDKNGTISKVYGGLNDFNYKEMTDIIKGMVK